MNKLSFYEQTVCYNHSIMQTSNHPHLPGLVQKGSQYWLQIAITYSPSILDSAFRKAGVIAHDEMIDWRSPIAADNFKEYQDDASFQKLGITNFPQKPLADFWPPKGPVWDGLALTKPRYENGIIAAPKFVLVEAKAHVSEVMSTIKATSPTSIAKIKTALNAAHKFYAPRSTKNWDGEYFYQYTNRLAHHYFMCKVNDLSSRLVFLDFYNAKEMNGPTNSEEWIGVTKLIHEVLGLPESLEKFGVFHVHIDVDDL
jgi:hypothetical protein